MKYSSDILMQLQVVLAFLFVMMISLYDLMEINRPEQIRSKLLVRLIQLRKTVTPILIAALLELPVLYFFCGLNLYLCHMDLGRISIKYF